MGEVVVRIVVSHRHREGRAKLVGWQARIITYICILTREPCLFAIVLSLRHGASTLCRMINDQWLNEHQFKDISSEPEFQD